MPVVEHLVLFVTQHKHTGTEESCSALVHLSIPQSVYACAVFRLEFDTNSLSSLHSSDSVSLFHVTANTHTECSSHSDNYVFSAGLYCIALAYIPSLLKAFSILLAFLLVKHCRIKNDCNVQCQIHKVQSLMRNCCSHIHLNPFIRDAHRGAVSVSYMRGLTVFSLTYQPLL